MTKLIKIAAIAALIIWGAGQLGAVLASGADNLQAVQTVATAAAKNNQ